MIEEFTTYFAQTDKLLNGFLYKTGVPVDHLDDVRQNAWLKAWQHQMTFRGDCAFRTWLFMIARNVWLETRRSKQHKGMDQLPDVFDCASPYPTPEMQLETTLVLEKTPIILRQKYFEGMTIDEVAAYHGITPHGMKTRLHRTRIKMRIKWKGEV